MTTMQTAVGREQTISEALESLRTRTITGQVLYIYVVDQDDRLVGVLPIRRLLFSPPEARVGDVMLAQSVAIPFDATLRDAFELFAKQRLLALPVVDAENRLLGTVDVQAYAEGAVGLAEQRQEEELFQMIGVSVEDARMGGPVRGFNLRMPWLGCNIVGGLSCAAIASRFEATTSEVVALVFFFPLVLTLGEAVAIQAHSIALPSVEQSGLALSALRRRTLVEAATSLLLGLACGAIAGIAAFLFGAANQRPGMALVMVASVTLGMMASAMAGTLVPALLRLFRMDPKLAAGPVALVVADVLNTVCYLGLATALLSSGVLPNAPSP